MNQHLAAVGEVFKAAISAASSGDQQLVAAVTGKKIRVLSMQFLCTAAVTVGFESNGSPDTALTGVMSFPDNGGMVLPHNPLGWFETNLSEALHITLGDAIQVSGSLTYQVIG